MANLYIVATPIGNLQDITLRALEILKSVDIVLAEDTREAKKLLNHFDITKTVITYHQHSSEETKLKILKNLMDGLNMALITDAGTPGISDPGNELVEFLYSNGLANNEIQIIPIPGPSSLTTALSVCGFDVSRFTFLGFWKKKKFAKDLAVITDSGLPVVFFESPYRIVKTLEILQKSIEPNRKIFVAQELTKLHERHIRGNISEAIEILKAEQKEAGRVRGEIVVVLDAS